MSYTPLDDDKLVGMYKSGITMSKIRKHFGVTNGTIYRHLRAKKVKLGRKISIPWTYHEEMLLIDAVRNGVTGKEYEEWVPTRSSYACKAHLRNMKPKVYKGRN